MSFLDNIFRKGRMGATISREETAERVDPILEQHVWLNHYYRYAIEHLEDRTLAERLAEQQRTARSDVGKLSETILSAGHVPFSGTGIEPEEIDLGSGDEDILRQVREAEEKMHDAIATDRDEAEHQMRTRAILDVVKTNSEHRLDLLRNATRRR